MKRKIKIYISQAADADVVNAFISTLVILVLKINGKDVKPFKAEFKLWAAKSSTLANQLGIKKEFTRIINIFQLKETFSEEDAKSLGKLLKSKEVRDLIERDTSISIDQKALITNCSGQLATDSTPAWKKISTNIALLRNPKLTNAFLPTVASDVPTVAIENLKKLATKMGGRPAQPFFTTRELTAFRKDPTKIKLTKEYSVAAKIVNDYVKSEVLQFVRASNKETVPITDVTEYLKKKHVPNTILTGLQGAHIDEVGSIYTKEGRKIDKKPYGVCIPNIKYNPATNNTYVFRVPGVGVFSTIETKVTNKKNAFAAVKHFYSIEKTSRAHWLLDLKQVGSKTQVMAAMVELIYQTSCRIGGKDNATKGEPTYGLSTLQVRHLQFHPSKVKPVEVQFNYSGKKQADQEHFFKTATGDGKKIGNLLKILVENKLPGDLIFSLRNKSQKVIKYTPVTATNVNKYLKSLGVQITAHKFRHLAGTKLAMKLLADCTFKKGACKQTEVEQWLKEEMKKVGVVLNHHTGTEVTGMTAITSYIDPVLLHEFFIKLGLRVPKFVPS